MVTTIIGRYWPTLVLIVVVAAVAKGFYSFGHQTADTDWQNRWNQRDADAAQAHAKLEQDYRHKEKELQETLHDQQVTHDLRLAEMQRIQLDAGTESDGLRRDNAKLRERLRHSGGDTADSWQLPAVTRAAMVLSVLYEGCVGHRQELAAAVDESRQRGLAVEQMYDRARGQ